MMSDFQYNVAIRTVGKAGDKYEREIRSLKAQSISPHRIVVYLAEGFEQPPRVADEEYVIVNKGLVHQRAVIPDDGSEFLLVLDDDVYLPPTAVEKMHSQIVEQGCDCIIPDTFPNHQLSWKQRLVAYMSNNVSSRANDGYAIRIKRSGAFSFNANPGSGALLPTQSGAGPAFFIKTEVFKDIAYSDEYWVDAFPPGTFYEDQLMYYKMYVNGVKMMMWFDSGVLHLDAGTNNQREKSYEKLMYRAMAHYVIWHRSVLKTRKSEMERALCHLAFFHRFLLAIVTRVVFSIVCMSPKHVSAYIKGIVKGCMFVNSNVYKALPSFLRNCVSGAFSYRK